MPEKRKGILILLCGMLIATATPRCHAQEPGKLFEVKLPQAEASPALVPKVTNNPVQRPADVKPDKEVSEKSWYRLFLEGVAISAAQYNTEKEDDGRPHPPGNSR